jgi:glycosyltransferase involved in cell wall biosynthesis
MRIHYPVSLYTPKVLRDWYGVFYERSIRGLFARLVREERPDVVYATWAYPDCYAASILAARHGLPLVARVHGSDINSYFAFPGRKRRIIEGLRRARAVVSVSAALRDLLVREGVASERIHLIYNGIDRDLFKPLDRLEARLALGLDPRTRMILYAGNLEPVKGLDRLIEAVRLMRTAGCELHIIGDGPERGRLAALVRRLPAGKTVRFHGRVEHRLMGMWLNACDVLALPSLAEGTPNVVLESLACRTPVVASDTGGIPEMLPAGSGMLVPPGDAPALARALDVAIERSWDRSRIECPAGSWEDNARALAGVLSRAAREANPPGGRS